MKKINYSINFILIFAVLILFSNFLGTTQCSLINSPLVLSENLTNVISETLPKPNEDELGAVIPNDQNGINDNVLYQSLINVYNLTYKSYIDSGELTLQTQLKVKMLKDIKTIDLENQSIYSINGLKYLDLGKLETLNLGQNNITEVKNEDIKDLYSLKQLDLHFNEISEFKIPNSLTNLNYLNLNKNYISKIDLSMLNVANVYLSFNKFINIDDIVLPRTTSTTILNVELFNNNITNADELFLKNGVTEIGGQINLELGLQGAGLNQRADVVEEEKVVPRVSRSNPIKFYNVTSYNLKVKISNPISNELIKIVENNLENKITEFVLPAGEYKLEYLNGTNDSPLYERNDKFLCAFKEIEKFYVVPKNPVVKFNINGKEFDEHGKFTSWDAKIVATNTDDVGKIYCSVDGGKWVEGSVVELKRGGQYTVSFKCVFQDGIESDIVTKQVYMSVNPYIPDAIMLLIIGIVVVLLFFVALPLIRKYVIKK